MIKESGESAAVPALKFTTAAHPRTKAATGPAVKDAWQIGGQSAAKTAAEKQAIQRRRAELQDRLAEVEAEYAEAEFAEAEENREPLRLSWTRTNITPPTCRPRSSVS